MLTKIRLRNFRGFADHELPISKMTLIVGRNNAGKSTVIEAIRFIGLATARYKTLPYREPPEEFGLSDTQRGISPSMRDLNFDQINLFHRYGDPPATIEAEFGDLGSITIYIRGSDELFIVIKDRRGQVIGSHPFARALNLPRIYILPQVAPVADVETELTPKYVRDSVSSPRASSHFRNQLYLFNDRFPDFKNLCEASWPRLQIHAAKWRIATYLCDGQQQVYRMVPQFKPSSTNSEGCTICS
jgi:hypothetical protein